MTHNPKLEWLPGPARSLSGGTSHPGFEHARAVAIAARATPGVWIDLRTHATSTAASKAANYRRRNPSVAFQPREAFEYRSLKRDDGYAVQVRYVRNSPESPASTPGSPPAQGFEEGGEVPALSPAVMGAGTEQVQT